MSVIGKNAQCYCCKRVVKRNFDTLHRTFESSRLSAGTKLTWYLVLYCRKAGIVTFLTFIYFFDRLDTDAPVRLKKNLIICIFKMILIKAPYNHSHSDRHHWSLRHNSQARCVFKMLCEVKNTSAFQNCHITAALYSRQLCSVQLFSSTREYILYKRIQSGSVYPESSLTFQCQYFQHWKYAEDIWRMWIVLERYIDVVNQKCEKWFVQSIQCPGCVCGLWGRSAFCCVECVYGLSLPAVPILHTFLTWGEEISSCWLTEHTFIRDLKECSRFFKSPHSFVHPSCSIPFFCFVLFFTHAFKHPEIHEPYHAMLWKIAKASLLL